MDIGPAKQSSSQLTYCEKPVKNFHVALRLGETERGRPILQSRVRKILYLRPITIAAVRPRFRGVLRP